MKSKSCKNNGCINNHPGEGESDCIRFTEPWNGLGFRCPKYADTAPIIFIPKDPDDYLPGCMTGKSGREDDCKFADSSPTWCYCSLMRGVRAGRDLTPEKTMKRHQRMCEFLPCYNPEKKKIEELL